MDDMEKMENDNIIVLTDEDGTDVEFEFCASIEYEGNEYVVLLPTDDDDGEVVPQDPRGTDGRVERGLHALDERAQW